METNYKFSCRCCLKSEAEFYKLDSLIECGSGENDASSTKIPLLRLLLFCMRIENQPELPQYICVECSKSLQISYYFIQNGLRAHEILCRKLCPGKLKLNSTRSNGQQPTQRLEVGVRGKCPVNMCVWVCFSSICFDFIAVQRERGCVAVQTLGSKATKVYDAARM